ncbi:hypothetical protein Vretimale_5317 [Volvox reticuliferus]|nr:hypothetical protein Vretimale_5317 [Volvox reticuliferus]
MEQARSGDMKVLKVPPFVKVPAKFLYRNIGSNPFIHFFLMLFRQYHLSVSQTLYNNARVLFIEKHGRDFDFNFHEVVIKGLEDELMHTLHPEWHLWIIAVIWYAIPPPAYVSFWMYGISVLIIMLVGGKLVDILVQIAVQVALKYGDSVVFGRMDDNPRAHGRIKALGRSSMRTIEPSQPSTQQNFMERIGKLSKQLESATRDDSDVAGPRAGGPSSLVQSTMASLGALFRPTSGEVVSGMFLSGTSNQREPGGQGQPQPVEKGARAEPATQTRASAIAVAPPAGKKVTGVDGCGAAAAAAPPTHQHMGLMRLSAPAELRRQQGKRFQSPHMGPLDSVNATGNGCVVHVVPPGAKRNMSAIIEQSTRHHLHHSRHHDHHHYHQHHQHQHQHQDQHDNHDRARLYGGGGVQQQHAKLCDDANRGPQNQPEPLRAPADGWKSAFAMFQHHPGHRPRTLSIRHALQNILGARGESSTSPREQQQQVPQQELLKMHCGRMQGDAVAPPNDTTAENAVEENGGADADAAAVLAEGPPPRDVSKRASAAANDIMTEITPANLVEVVMNSKPSPRGDPLGGEPSIRRRPQAFTSACGFSGCYGSESYSSGNEDGAPVRRRRSVLRPRRTASGRRRKVPLLMRPFYCGTYVKGSSEYVRDVLGRSQQLDAVELFWFKRPRFMTMLFTLAYFQNSLSIAICIFALAGMQDAVSTWQDVPKWAIIVQLCLDVVLVPQVSLSILPFYALIQPLGSHCSKDLIDYAIRNDQHAKPRRNRTLMELWRRTRSQNTPSEGQERSILGRLGFLGAKKPKRGNPSPAAPAEAPAEAPPAPGAHQLSYRLTTMPDKSKSFASAWTSPMLPFGPSVARTASAAFPSRLKPNGGAVRTASQHKPLSVRRTEPQPAALQLEVWNPTPILNGAPKRADSAGHRTIATAGDQQPLQSQVQVVIGRQPDPEPEPEPEPEPRLEPGLGPQTQADSGRPQLTEMVAAAAGAATGAECAATAGPLSQHSSSGSRSSSVTGHRGKV